MRALGVYLCAKWRHPLRGDGLKSLEFASRTPAPVKLGDLDCATQIFTLAQKYKWAGGAPGIVGSSSGGGGGGGGGFSFGGGGGGGGDDGGSRRSGGGGGGRRRRPGGDGANDGD